MVDPKRFSEAVWSGDIAVVDQMIAAGADVNLADAPRQPPLFLAIEQQWIEIVRRLVRAGAEVNQDIGNGWTPLVHAIDIESDSAWQANHEPGHASAQLSELLLAAGAVPTPRAFEVAKNYGHDKATQLLQRYEEATMIRSHTPQNNARPAAPRR